MKEHKGAEPWEKLGGGLLWLSIAEHLEALVASHPLLGRWTYRVLYIMHWGHWLRLSLMGLFAYCRIPAYNSGESAFLLPNCALWAYVVFKQGWSISLKRIPNLNFVPQRTWEDTIHDPQRLVILSILLISIFPQLPTSTFPQFTKHSSFPHSLLKISISLYWHQTPLWKVRFLVPPDWFVVVKINRAKTCQYHPPGTWNILNLPKVSYYNVQFCLPGLRFSFHSQWKHWRKKKSESREIRS